MRREEVSSHETHVCSLLCLAAAGLMVSTPSRRASAVPPAQTHPVNWRKSLRVETRGCDGLDANRLRNLLALEVEDVLRSVPRGTRIRVLVRCGPQGIAVAVADPLTGKEVRRPVPGLNLRQPGRERVLALSASQLLLASWMELLTPRFQKKPKAGRAAAAARSLAESAIRKTVSLAPERNMAMGLSLASGIADLNHPFAVFGGRLWVSFAFSRSWSVSALVTMQGGMADRQSGSVQVLMAGADVAVTWTWLRRGRFSMTSGLELGGHYLSLTGLPASEEFRGSTFGHMVGRAAATLGARFQWSRFRLGADVSAALVFPWVAGLVVGEPAVRPYGAWIQGVLVAELLF